MRSHSDQHEFRTLKPLIFLLKVSLSLKDSTENSRQTPGFAQENSQLLEELSGGPSRGFDAQRESFREQRCLAPESAQTTRRKTTCRVFEREPRGVFQESKASLGVSQPE